MSEYGFIVPEPKTWKDVEELFRAGNVREPSVRRYPGNYFLTNTSPEEFSGLDGFFSSSMSDEWAVEKGWMAYTTELSEELINSLRTGKIVTFKISSEQEDKWVDMAKRHVAALG
ncbi:hypothetical protein [Pseudomonas sp. TWP3-1]|uniref:hypothetical protein n=1 Tax=Pseudomonas sp. TWP3-1 TaxID=2804631 RepID=UPI003CFA62B9